MNNDIVVKGRRVVLIIPMTSTLIKDQKFQWRAVHKNNQISTFIDHLKSLPQLTFAIDIGAHPASTTIFFSSVSNMPIYREIRNRYHWIEYNLFIFC